MNPLLLLLSPIIKSLDRIEDALLTIDTKVGGRHMTIDEMLTTLPTPTTADEILNVMSIVMTAEDLNPTDRAGFAAGFMAGMTYVLAKSSEGNVKDAARTLHRLQNEMAAHQVWG